VEGGRRLSVFSLIGTYGGKAPKGGKRKGCFTFTSCNGEPGEEGEAGGLISSVRKKKAILILGGPKGRRGSFSEVLRGRGRVMSPFLI